MTFSVQRKTHVFDDAVIPAGVVGSGFAVGVHSGPISITVDETYAGHLRQFHTDLGHLLDQFEAELREQAETGVRPR